MIWLKKIGQFTLALFLALTLSACGGSAQTPETNNTPAAPSQASETKKNNGKILIAYFSRTGNTEKVARHIQAQVGGDLFEIRPVKAYPEEYQAAVDQARQELDSNARPAIMETPKNLQDYDIIFLGYPIWWGTMPMAVYTFLEAPELAQKTIIPFGTHGGSRLGRSESDLARLLPQAKILEGIAIRGSDAQNSQEELSSWLNRLKMIN